MDDNNKGNDDEEEDDEDDGNERVEDNDDEVTKFCFCVSYLILVYTEQDFVSCLFFGLFGN